MNGFRFTVRNDQRAAIVGRTDSGKTTLAKLLVQQFRTLVAIDPKRRLELPGTVTVYGLDGFRNTWPQRARRVIVRPSDADLGDPKSLWEFADGVFGRVLQYGRTAVLVDEALDFAPATRIVPNYRRALRLGREPLIPVFSLSQRPRDLHNDVLSESEHLFVFDLQLETDRKKVAAIGGPELLTRADLRFPQHHGFAYYGPDTGGRVIWCPPLSAGPAAPSAPLNPAPVAEPGG